MEVDGVDGCSGSGPKRASRDAVVGSVVAFDGAGPGGGRAEVVVAVPVAVAVADEEEEEEEAAAFEGGGLRVK